VGGREGERERVGRTTPLAGPPKTSHESMCCGAKTSVCHVSDSCRRRVARHAWSMLTVATANAQHDPHEPCVCPSHPPLSPSGRAERCDGQWLSSEACVLRLVG
jgi:hypothetical protein